MPYPLFQLLARTLSVVIASLMVASIAHAAGPAPLDLDQLMGHVAGPPARYETLEEKTLILPVVASPPSPAINLNAQSDLFQEPPQPTKSSAKPKTVSAKPKTKSTSPAKKLPFPSGYKPRQAASQLVAFPKTPPWAAEQMRLAKLKYAHETHTTDIIPPGSGRPIPPKTFSSALSKPTLPPPPPRQSASTRNYAVDLLENNRMSVITEDAMPLGLMDTMQMALQHNLAITIANIQRDKAIHGQREAIGSFLPDLLLSYRQSRFQGGVQVFNGDPNRALISTIQPEARVRLPVNLGGEAIFNYKAKAAEAQVKAVAIGTIKEESLLQVGEQYLQLVEAILQWNLARQTQEETQAQLTLSQARFDEGVGVLVEVLESQSQAEREARRQLEARQLIRQRNIDLNVPLGLPPDVSVAPKLESVLQASLYGPDTTLETLQAYAQTHSPVLQEAQFNIKSKQARYKQSVALALPTVNLSAYINLIGNRIDNLETSRFAGLEATTSFLEGLGVKRFQQVRQAQQEVKEALIRLEQAEREVKANVAKAYVGWQTSQERLQLAKKQLETTEQARYQAMGRYEAGIGSYLETVTAATRLQEARTTYLNLVLDQTRAQLRLGQAAGQLRQLVSGVDPMALNTPQVPVTTKQTASLPNRKKAP